MADIKEQMAETLEHLKQQRDELQVQLHLAKGGCERRMGTPGESVGRNKAQAGGGTGGSR